MMKVLEIEGQYAFGIMGSLANITKVINALDQCEMVDVSFDHDPEGTSQYYAVSTGKSRNFTIKELPTLTKAEFDGLQKQRQEEREAAEKDVEENPCCTDGCAICKPEVYGPDGETGPDLETPEEYDPETDCGCNGNKTCSECS